MERTTLGTYKNGNYIVTILSDGTKIRYGGNADSSAFKPERPESIDIKITNRCDMACSMCHEESHIAGEHADILNLPFMEDIDPFTELAIGGGNVFEHPDLIEFLELCKEKKLIPSITVNQYHFMNHYYDILDLVNSGLVYGVGISLMYMGQDDWIRRAKTIRTAVIHTTVGLVDNEDILKLTDSGLKILCLGYKEFGRGKQYGAARKPYIDSRSNSLRKALPTILETGATLIFDNLAIEQLQIKEMAPNWETVYMGDEGQFTMYVDAVEMKYGKNSVTEKEDRKDCGLLSLRQMFKNL